MRELARVAGHLHDIGKASARFQDYIRGRATSGGDHATAGAREAIHRYGPDRLGRLLALVIASHHSGLADADVLDRRLAADLPDYAGWEAQTEALPDAATLVPTRSASGVPPDRRAFAAAFAVRMLFSCLVDADFIATETFMAGRERLRGGMPDVAILRERLRRHVHGVQAGAKRNALNALRTEILDHAVPKATEPPGFFTLTVPTGGGKTLASLAFALEHAAAHGKRRVVVVIPFTAIIDQTASVYRAALGEEAVLEHHSSFDSEDSGRGDDDGGRLRRAAENWDAPVVVTTAVQFFESLFANRTSRCRKLHNLADAVIVLDEAQATPPGLLLPCLAALDELRRAYGASIVLCTATQPAWRVLDGALVERLPSRQLVERGLDVADSRELAPRPAALATELRRTRVEVLADPVDDAGLAEAFARAPRMLCIVNSRAHARAVFERIRDMEGAAHLTTLMCPAHRREVLGALRGRLDEGASVRLVATSLIEAGVDISFPVVWRAAAGLDSVAQAAGRCNREGELLPALGRVVVFRPAAAPVPRSLFAFQQAAAPILRDEADPLAPDAIRRYFRLLYAQKGMAALDAAKVGDLTGILPAINATGAGFRFPFESIARAFKMIDETMLPVIVPWNGRATSLLERLAAPDVGVAGLMRALQPFIVGIPERARRDWLAQGVLAPVRHDLGDGVVRLNDLRPLYDRETGLDLSDGAYRTAEDNLW